MHSLSSRPQANFYQTSHPPKTCPLPGGAAECPTSWLGLCGFKPSRHKSKRWEHLGTLSRGHGKASFERLMDCILNTIHVSDVLTQTMMILSLPKP